MSRRVLITAGAAGIGLAMARAFAAKGDRVWITDVNPSALDAAPGEWCKTLCDVADDAAMMRLEDAIAVRWGGLEVVCANAGIKGPTAPIDAMDRAEWEACVGVNLTGAMLTARLAARFMRPAGRGVITFTSSTAGLQGFPFRSPYAAAKWGVIGLMKSVAMELGPHGIRANAICPGSVAGDRIDRVIAAEAEAKGLPEDALRAVYVAGTALKRFVQPEDVADLALYLASDGARMVTGQAVPVDGFTYNADR